MCHPLLLLATRKSMGARSCVPQFLRELLPACTLPDNSIGLLKSPENGNLLLFRLCDLSCFGWGLRLALAVPLCAQHLALAHHRAVLALEPLLPVFNTLSLVLLTVFGDFCLFDDLL